MVVSRLIVCKEECDRVLDLRELTALGKIRCTDAVRIGVGAERREGLVLLIS